MGTHALDARSADRSTFQDPNETAAREVSIKLLREILEYQRRLNRLAERSDSAQKYLMNAYRKAIRLRREMLRDLPLPIDRAGVDPWPT